MAVDNIPSTQHPVKVGLSDAYYIDTTTTYSKLLNPYATVVSH